LTIVAECDYHILPLSCSIEAVGIRFGDDGALVGIDEAEYCLWVAVSTFLADTRSLIELKRARVARRREEAFLMRRL
jgi:hypothetical protein